MKNIEKDSWEEKFAQVAEMVDTRIRQHCSRLSDNVRRDVAEEVSEQLTGDRYSPYVYGLMSKMFRPEYNRKQEWSWVLRDATEKRRISNRGHRISDDELQEVHREYARHLWRCADIDAVRCLSSSSSSSLSSSESAEKLAASPEAKSV